ncbi:MAG TPA: DUF4383 domain-containing protein [Solirubrobacteraceae bacterium]|jgi:hypothetical protein|nr:DUF4383 domain-containing protein [Solirubrobacteraceae bacterium]
MTTGAHSLDSADRGRGRTDHRGRTPAQWFCLLAGAALLLAGILGFIADATFDAGGELQGDSFLGFEVNGWHNLVHVASGLLLLSAFGRRATARTVALVFGALYAIVTLIGLIDGNDVVELLPVNAADNVLHLVLSAAAILAALASRPDRHRDGDRGRVHRAPDPDLDPDLDRDRDRFGERLAPRNLNRTDRR